jgi:hypothetical protein
VGRSSPSLARAVHDPGLLVRRCMRSYDLTVDRPDERGQLAGDRSHHDRRSLALSRQCPEAATEPHLRLPGNLAGRPWRGADPGLHVLADAWRESVAASMSSRRARVLPALVMPPRLTLSPVDLSDGVRPR